LVELGANVNAQNNLTGATPLHMVAQSNKATIDARLQVIDILIDGGAHPDQMDKYGSLPFQLVESSNEGKELDDDTKRLLAKLRPQQPKIHKAIMDRNTSTLEKILSDNSSDANVIFQGQTPLSFAISNLLESVTNVTSSSNDTIQILQSIIKILLTKGADPNCALADTTDVADEKEPVLHKLVSTLRECDRAIENDVTKQTITILRNVIDLLFQAGVIISNDTKLLLHQAARFNECTFATYLLTVLQIDPNMKGRQGMTPLHFAARSGKVEMLVRFICGIV
jgi:ankyrin repeat protein